MEPARSSARRRLLWSLGPLIAWGLAFVCLQQPGPLFVNLGVGDGPFTRGFRAGWERDGLTGSGETTFHWTEDGARIELPVEVESGTLTARLRLARFSDSPASISLLANDRLVDQWVQPPRGWLVRSVELGAARGTLRLQFRSESKDGLGVALDWVEILGAGRIVPQARLTGPIVLLGVILPLLAWVVLGGRAALVFGVGLPALLAIGFRVDRLGVLVAAARGANPALVVAILVLLASRLFVRLWPEGEARSARLVPLAAGVLAVLALQHPFFYYPDVDTHARFIAALHADPSLAFDATPYQLSSGTWATRVIAGKRVLFPYSPAFHVLALPVVAVLGDLPTAVKTLGATAFAVFLLLVHAAARAAGLGPRSSRVAQVIAALVPVEASRLSLALYPGLLGQACDLLLVTFLLRSYPRLPERRALAATAAFLIVAQAAYTGSIFNVAGLVACFVLFELVRGERRAALGLLGAYAVAAGVVLAVQYARFIPVLLRDVLPQAQSAPTGAGAAASPAWLAATRLFQFYGAALLLLAGLGTATLRAVPLPHVRRLLAAVVTTGMALLVLRYAAPSVFKDAKEVELLAAPLAILGASGLAFLWQWGRPGRALAALGAGAFLVFAGAAVAAAYGARFVAIGR